MSFQASYDRNNLNKDDTRGAGGCYRVGSIFGFPVLRLEEWIYRVQ